MYSPAHHGVTFSYFWLHTYCFKHRFSPYPEICIIQVDVNGQNAAPIYKFLKSSKGGLLGDGIKWNFAKFLVDKDGNVVDRYAPTTSPLSIEVRIKKISPLASISFPPPSLDCFHFYDLFRCAFWLSKQFYTSILQKNIKKLLGIS